MSKEKVLIVDDDAAIRYTLTEALRGWGNEPLEAGTAEERIIETANEWGADLVVLGSVSQAVAYHAPCSVEIVRKKNGERVKGKRYEHW